MLDDKLGRNDSVVIVMSSLVSLMLDQVQSVRGRLVTAAIMSSGQSKLDKEFLVTDDDIRECRLLFCAPEGIDTSNVGRASLKQTSLAPFANVLGTTIVHSHGNIQ